MILAALTLAALFALLYDPSQRLCNYIYAKMYGNILLFAVNHWWGDKSLFYGIIYVLVTGIVLATVIALVAGIIEHRQNSWRGAAFIALAAWAFALFCYFNMGKHDAYDLVCIAEGAILFWAGLTAGLLAPYVKNMGIAIVLSGLWLSQSAFRVYHYVWEHPVMEWLNWKLPPVLGITAFLLIGLLQRRQLYRDCRP